MESIESLREVLDQLQESFVVCDAEDRIVFTNLRFRTLNAPLEAWTTPGTPFEAYLRAALARGHYMAARGREDEWLAESRARRRGETGGSFEFERSDGIWMLSTFSRLANGSSITFAVDITARKRADAALLAQTERLEIGQRAAGMIVMDWDIRKDELTWSDSPEWLRGPLPAGAKYPLYKDQVHPDDRERFLAVRDAGVDTLRRHDHEYRIVRTDGKLLWIYSQRVVLPGTDGKAARMLVALHDVTKRKQAELALQQMNEQLERHVDERTAALESAYRELESFSYSVSHDLRAPLRAIAGFADILADDEAGRMTEQGRRYLSMIERNAQRMGGLIDALLKLMRASRQSMQREPLDMPSLARAVCTDLSSEFPHVRISLGPMPPAFGDATLVAQVFANLIGNAAKYSAKAALPKVEVGAGDVPGGVAYFVRDNGIGFAMAHAGNLFKPFQRLHSDPEYAGTGVGLALASRIVERHGGRIWAESAPGQGAVFHFTLAGGGA